MAQEGWTNVDKYFSQHLLSRDAALELALKRNSEAGLPPHDVAPNQGKLLHLIALISKSKRVLEIGTLGGYSTIWFAKALPPDGLVVSLEVNEHYAAVAKANIAASSLTSKVDIITGPAELSLETLYKRNSEKFDLVFIDADKPSNAVYLKWAIELAKDEAIIIGDNVVRDGAVTQSSSTDARVQGIRDFIKMIGDDPRLEATAIQTVGAKGWDGFTIAVLNKIHTS